jgi:hypothetical protein
LQLFIGTPLDLYCPLIQLTLKRGIWYPLYPV